MDTGEAVRNRIIELCEEKRWRTRALAGFAGIPPTTLRHIIKGRSDNPGILTIKKICDGLGISLADFFNTPVFQNLEQEIK